MLFFSSYSAYFLNNPRKWFSLQYKTRDEKQQHQKHIRFRNVNLKKDAVSSVYPRFLTYRSYLSVTKKSNTYDVSLPQAFISKNKSVSLNQVKGLWPWQQAKNKLPGYRYYLIFIYRSFGPFLKALTLKKEHIDFTSCTERNESLSWLYFSQMKCTQM